MSRYMDIESEELRKLRQISDETYDRLEHYCGAEYATGYADGWKNAIGKAINKTPTVDVEEVLRCKDCKYCDKEYERVHWCNRIRFRCQLTTPDDYYSRGRKRNERQK